MGLEEDDFVFHGTPIEREDEIGSRKKKAVAGASGNLRTLPAWKQEVTDEEGRRRFHGAFTGGYSAGYYNTVGSKEGWAPQSFTSSRKNRAGARRQNISDFLDEDEKAELEGQSLSASSQFDTFGFTAAEHSRKQAEKEQHERPSAIPGPVHDELIAPVSESIGVKLLLKMGWRRGHSIKDVRAGSDARREARKAFLAFSADESTKGSSDSLVLESEVKTSLDPQINEDIKFSETTPVYVLNPKQDLHGLGYDPFKHAPEFREKKRSRLSAGKEAGYKKPLSMKESLFGPNTGKIGPGFGIGALEELDVEDEDVYAGYDFNQTYVIEDEQPVRPHNDNTLRLTSKEHNVLPGFGAASNSDYSVERFDPPKIPKDFVARHKFLGPRETETKLTASAPPDVPPPEDKNLKILIDGFATFVSRCGKLYEDLSREKNESNQLFDFLRGGSGHDYYVRRLWEEQQKRGDQSNLQLDVKVPSSVEKMTAEKRGSLLGERPLQKSLKETETSASSGGSFQFPTNLSDTFTKSASSQEAADAVKPFKYDPAKQERFEQFLKEKYKGGLRTTDSSRFNSMSEAARAQERLDFEAAAEAIEKGKAYKEVRRATERPIDFLAGGLQFTSGGTEQSKDSGVVDMKSSKTYPKREEFQWRPAPLLCKRFDLPDPFMGKPGTAPRARNKMDSLIFLPDTVKAASDLQEPKKETTVEEPEVEVQVENVERPVDLYKAIFSDDSEDDEEQPMNGKKEEGQEKKNEAAAATTLNRLIAGDFLESLGKELGFEVPSNVTYPEGTKPVEEDSKSKRKSDASSERRPETKEKPEEKTSSLKLGSEGEKSTKRSEKSPRNWSGEEKSTKNKEESPRNDLSSSDSSGDEGRRRRSKKDKHRNNDSESDSSSDYHSRDKRSSRSRRKRRESSRENRSSHKKHYKTKDSSSSRYSMDEDRKESRREKRRHRD
ncbi:PREDICTED: G patch domain-containing protein TGH-like isoform X1 [Brassica oleracea var. oleracea]|uniref:SURP motif domain-containing protein n=1 Tax=Brassica oleracea var. oleracea TaxID=109376 RepID=A0A0D3E1N0_BRAOL|nr:PREDICTED: G patch domain-containing protein TGH-like isoform X1 [Brassica oleracea var. oleracea]